jgi:predicted RNase H-like HicB family nuclease
VGADIPVLPGCAAWSYTREEALEALQDTAQAFLEVMIEHNDPLPQEAEEEAKNLTESDVVTVTV